jgi:hypothetical protein
MIALPAGLATSFVPVPAQTPLTGYWRRKDDRTTPSPQPIDLLLEGSWLLHRAKAGAQGIEVGTRKATGWYTTSCRQAGSGDEEAACGCCWSGAD